MQRVPYPFGIHEKRGVRPFQLQECGA